MPHQVLKGYGLEASIIDISRFFHQKIKKKKKNERIAEIMIIFIKN